MENLTEKFEKNLISLSDQEVINSFNKEVGNTGWVAARAHFLKALINQFESREIDYSIIKNENTISFAKKVFLIEKTQELVDLKEKLSEKDVHEHALGIVSEVVPLMEEIRKMADSIEIYLSADNQFYPNYRSLFSLSS